MARQNKLNWSACKKELQALSSGQLTDLLHEIYDLAPENKQFLHARLFSNSTESLGEAIKRLKKLLMPGSIFDDRFRHADAKKIVDQFHKASPAPALLAELLLADLTQSLSTLASVGDYEPLVDHIYASLSRLDKVLAELPPEVLEPLLGRINALATKWQSKFGYGISDELQDFAATWSRHLSLSHDKKRIP